MIIVFLSGAVDSWHLSVREKRSRQLGAADDGAMTVEAKPPSLNSRPIYCCEMLKQGTRIELTGPKQGLGT